MSADRIVKRRQWRDIHPPVFDRAQKMRRLELAWLKIDDLRTSWQEFRAEKGAK